jgi:hypothetical protein
MLQCRNTRGDCAMSPCNGDLLYLHCIKGIIMHKIVLACLEAALFFDRRLLTSMEKLMC